MFMWLLADWAPEQHVAWKTDPFIFWIVKMHLTLLPWGNVDKAFCLRIMVDNINFAPELLRYTPANTCRPNREVCSAVVHVVAWNWRFLTRVSWQHIATFFLRESVKTLKCVTTCWFHNKIPLCTPTVGCYDLRLILSIEICWNITGCQAVEISTVPDKREATW